MGRKDYELSFSESSSSLSSSRAWYRRPCHPLTTFIIAAASAVIIATAVGVAVAFGRSCDQSEEQLTTPPTVTTTIVPERPGLDELLLPKSLKPLHYSLTLRPEFYPPLTPQQFFFNGSVHMTLQVLETTALITVHVKSPLQVIEESVSVTSQQGQRLEIAGVTYEPRLEIMRIQVSGGGLEGGSLVGVHMNFTSGLDNNLAGLYYSQYSDAEQTRYLVASHLHPTEARRVFPCFDEPALKSTFSVSIERLKDYTSLSNTDIAESRDLGDGWVVDIYHPTPPMSTYLLAFVVSNFTCRTNYTNNNKPVLVCARPNAYEQTEYASNIAARIQDNLEEYYNVTYPLNRTVHVAVPDFPAGAMENWGCVLYRETSLLYDPEKSSTANKQRVASVVAHELAHMWFGDLVTPGWWDDIWLNEGFASYMEYIGVHSVELDWNMAAQFLSSDLHPVMKTDSLLSSHPIYQSVSNPEEINELFDSISYSKGASVIRMMASFLGEEIFQAGISRYLEERAYNVTHHIDLFETLTKVANERDNNVNVTEVMLTWILQMGYPIVTMTYFSSTKLVSFNQSHFLTYKPTEQNTTAPPSQYDYIWHVPVTLITSDQTSPPLYWLNSTTGGTTFETEAEVDWLIGNVNQSHYYRVTYDNEMWARLESQLLTNHAAISEPDRAQLIDDAFSLARPGILNQVTALNISLYLANEIDYVPWTAASTNFNYLQRMMKTTAALPLLQSYVTRQVTRVYDEVGWTPSDRDTHLNRLLRPLVIDLACGYGMRDCLDKASNLYRALIDNDTLADNNTFSVDVQSSVYCYGISEGGLDEWMFAFNRYNSSNIAAEQSMLLQALACTQDSYILADYLQRALTERDIRRQDFSSVVSHVARNRNGEQLAWDLVRINWDTIYERFGSTSLYALSNLISGVTESFSTHQRLTELQEFMTRVSEKLGSAARAFEQSVERTQANIEWREREEHKVRDWLLKHQQ